MNPGIIFDFDGVIIDSIPAHKKNLKKIAEKHNISFEKSDFDTFNGMSTKEGFRRLIKERKLHKKAFWLALDLKFERRNIMKNIKVFPESKKCLLRLKKKYPLAVATSSRRKYLQKNLERFDLDYFDVHLSKNDVKHAKPDPSIFLRAAEKLGKKPQDCIVIEDALNGIIAAKRAGMKTIALLTTTKKSLFTREAKPDMFIRNLDELNESLIKKLK